jgi:hypothetical protein
MRVYLEDELTEAEVQFTKDWISALRSGEYKQGREYLKTSEGNFCCLGVACELSEYYIPSKTEYSTCFAYEIEGAPRINYRSLSPYNTLVLKSCLGGSPLNYFESLSSLNDKGHSFEVIANLIEADLEKRLDYITYDSILNETATKS